MSRFNSSSTKLTTSNPLDKDKLSMVPRETAARLALLALHQMQDEFPEEVILGVSTLFAAFTLRCGLDPQDLHHKGLRVLQAPEEGDRPTDATIQVLRDFAGARLMGKEVTIQ